MYINSDLIANNAKTANQLNLFFESFEQGELKEKRIKELTSSFSECRNLLSSAPSAQELTKCAHIAFAIYRLKVVEMACQQAKKNLSSWGFSQDDWNLQVNAFRDYVWIQSKMMLPLDNFVNTIIQESYPGFKIKKPLNVLTFSQGKEDFCPQKGIIYKEWFSDYKP